jgi:hypothetical protein
VSALSFLDITPKVSSFTMFVMSADDELFPVFETVCSTFTGLCYGQEKRGYRALLILLECCTTNICAADFSWKVVSLVERIHLNRVTVPYGSDSASH